VADRGETWRKRRYKAAFASRPSDAETEAAETQVWMKIALNCGYVDKPSFAQLTEQYDMVIGKLIRMIDSPDSWLMLAKTRRTS
jgi:four helix bundle protein